MAEGEIITKERHVIEHYDGFKLLGRHWNDHHCEHCTGDEKLVGDEEAGTGPGATGANTPAPTASSLSQGVTTRTGSPIPEQGPARSPSSASGSSASAPSASNPEIGTAGVHGSTMPSTGGNPGTGTPSV